MQKQQFGRTQTYRERHGKQPFAYLMNVNRSGEMSDGLPQALLVKPVVDDVAPPRTL